MNESFSDLHSLTIKCSTTGFHIPSYKKAIHFDKWFSNGVKNFHVKKTARSKMLVFQIYSKSFFLPPSRVKSVVVGLFESVVDDYM